MEEKASVYETSHWIKTKAYILKLEIILQKEKEKHFAVVIFS